MRIMYAFKRPGPYVVNHDAQMVGTPLHGTIVKALEIIYLYTFIYCTFLSSEAFTECGDLIA